MEAQISKEMRKRKNVAINTAYGIESCQGASADRAGKAPILFKWARACGAGSTVQRPPRARHQAGWGRRGLGMGIGGKDEGTPLEEGEHRVRG